MDCSEDRINAVLEELLVEAGPAPHPPPVVADEEAPTPVITSPPWHEVAAVLGRALLGRLIVLAALIVLLVMIL